MRAALDRTLCGPERKCSLRFRLRHSLGHYAWVQHQSVVECDDAGIAVRMYGSHTLPSNLEHADEAQGRTRPRTRWRCCLRWGSSTPTPAANACS